MGMSFIYAATEDELSEVLADRLIATTDDLFTNTTHMGRKGCTYLKRKLPELLKLAGNIPVLLLVDLDRGSCAPALISSWMRGQHQPNNLLLRVIVREAEAWLLADQQGFSDYFGVPLNKLPQDPETMVDPKEKLLSLVWNYTKQPIKGDVVVKSSSGLRQALSYNARMRDFVHNGWSLQRACASADSLSRACNRMQQLSNKIRNEVHI